MYRTDVDDLASVFVFDQVFHKGLRGKEHTFQVDVENGIIVCLRHVPESSMFFQFQHCSPEYLACQNALLE